MTKGLIKGGSIVTAVDDYVGSLLTMMKFIIVHLSAKEALDAIIEARDRGIPAFDETCPHYLFLDKSEYDRPNFESAKYVMTPPLRDHHCQHALWRGLRFDDLQIVFTDHCPFCFNENLYGILKSEQYGKEDFSKIPNGASGVEFRFTMPRKILPGFYIFCVFYKRCFIALRNRSNQNELKNRSLHFCFMFAVKQFLPQT